MTVTQLIAAVITRQFYGEYMSQFLKSLLPLRIELTINRNIERNTGWVDAWKSVRESQALMATYVLY